MIRSKSVKKMKNDSKPKNIHIDEMDFYNYFTPERVKKIQEKDGEAVIDCFTKYYNLFEFSAKKFLNKRNNDPRYSELSYLDCLGEIILDIPYYKFEKPSKFANSVGIKLLTILDGGFEYIMTNNRKYFNSSYRNAEIVNLYFDFKNDDSGIGEEGILLDFLEMGEKSPEDIYIDKLDEILSPELEDVVRFCKSLLNGKTAECFDLLLEGCSKSYIATELGSNTIKSTRKQILSHYEELKPLLIKSGVYSKEFDEIVSNPPKPKRGRRCVL